MLRLRQYKPEDAATIVTWCKDEESFRKWTSDRYDSFPITAEDMKRKYIDNNGDCEEPDNFYSLTAFDESGIVGHLILRYMGAEKKEMRIGFVIVDDTKRGKGYGREMIQLALYRYGVLEGESLIVLNGYKTYDLWYNREVFMDIKYRQITKEDGYEWYTLLDKVWRASYGHIFPEKVFAARENAMENRLSCFTEDKFIGERKTAYVAEHEGKIIGLMFGTLDSGYEYFKNDYADLVALYIDPGYQGMGIGTALRDIFINWAKERNADQMVIGVLKENTKARKVYESWGGTLSEYEQDFVQMKVGYPEVFYTYKI